MVEDPAEGMNRRKSLHTKPWRPGRKSWSPPNRPGTFTVLDEGAKRWMMRYVTSNYWRLAARCDLDDLIQEGYAAYYEVLQRYPAAKEPRHIMSLFMLVLRSRIESLVRSERKHIDDAASDYLDRCEFSDYKEGNAPEGLLTKDFSTFYAQLIKAPKIVQDVVEALMTGQNEEILSQPYKRYDNGRRETFNERLCSILGVDPRAIDVVGLTRKQFA